MLKPRHLPPAHKNQLFIPVKCLGLSEDRHQEHTPRTTFFRNHEITKKRLKPQASGVVFTPSNNHNHITVPHRHRHHHHNDDDDYEGEKDNDKDSSSSSSPKSFMTSLIHVRGIASELDVADVTLNVETPRKSPTSALTSISDTDKVKVSTLSPDKDKVKVSAAPTTTDTSASAFLTDDTATTTTSSTTSVRHSGGRCSVLSPILLECSKYTVIGEPRFRKRRPKRRDWTLPQPEQLTQQRQHQQHKQQQHQGGSHEPESSPSYSSRMGPPISNRKTNSIDVNSIYGVHSKLYKVPAEVRREDTVILPPLEIGRRREEIRASVDPHCLQEKRLVMNSQRQQGVYRRIFRDNVAFPTAYRPYFRTKQRQRRFARSVFAPSDVWENNPRPVHCSRCDHQSAATLHYCDVLGKRFCRFCCEMTDRAFSDAYEGNRLLVASPHRTPTLLMTKESSFIGVRKIVITKTTSENGQGQDQGQGRDVAAAHIVQNPLGGKLKG